MSQWHYSRHDQQLGPVTTAALRHLAASGQLQPADLVWKEGMDDWAQARTVAGLFDVAPVARAVSAGADPESIMYAVPVDDDFVAPQPDTRPTSEIGYFNPSAGLNARVEETLKGFPPPIGPQGQWPLLDNQLDQLKEAEKHRKVIRTCSAFFNTLCLLYVILAAAFLVAAALPRGLGPPKGPETVVMFGACVVMFVLAALAYFAKNAVMRCRIWAPITFLSIFSIGLVLNMVTLAVTPFRGSDPFGPAVATICIFIFTALFAWPCIRVLFAIPKFRACPLWAQEALVYAKL
jgi:hypothetical protein